MERRSDDQVLAAELIDFGEVSPAVDRLLQRGVAAYRHDRAEAERLFRQALETAPGELPTYFCLYKIHTYQGNLDAAQAMALAGLAEATRQAGWPRDWTAWPRPATPCDGPARFALYTLKALAFIHLRRSEGAEARAILDELGSLDPAGEVGWPVVAALAEGLAV